mgnify:CR=1 FL=1
MANITPLSNDTEGSGDTCILCLDEVDENTVWFPSFYSSCRCKYALHLSCIKDNAIDKCIICKSEIIYPIPIKLLKIDTFNIDGENEDIETRIDKYIKHIIHIENVSAHIEDLDDNYGNIENELVDVTDRDRNNHCLCMLNPLFRRICCITSGVLLICGVGSFIWYGTLY